MNEYNSEYQKSDLELRKIDPYSHTKYSILLSYLPKNKALQIVNIGAGYGDISFILNKLGHSITNIDPSTENILYINEQCEKKSIKNMKNIVSPIEAYESHETYDCIVITEVMEHIENDYLAMTKIAKLARKNTLLLVTVPALQSLRGNHDMQLGHQRRYTKKTIKKLLSKDFDNVHIRYFGFFLIPIAYYYSKIVKKYYPLSSIQNNFVLKVATRIVLFIERHIAFPIGTSLIINAYKK